MFGEIRCSHWGDPAIPSTGYRVKRILSFLSISGAIYPVTAIWVALSPRANDPSRLSLPLWEMHIRSVLCVCRVFSCGEDGLCYSERARMHLPKLFWALTLSSQSMPNNPRAPLTEHTLWTSEGKVRFEISFYPTFR